MTKEEMIDLMDEISIALEKHYQTKMNLYPSVLAEFKRGLGRNCQISLGRIRSTSQDERIQKVCTDFIERIHVFQNAILEDESLWNALRIL